MLVEDDPAVRRSLHLLLRARGYDVRAHASAKTLLADPALETAACLISDYRLADGDGDGVAVLRTLRDRGWFRPALLITGFNSHDVTERALAAGFATVIEKPLSEGLLAGTVARLVDVVPSDA